MRVRHTAPRGSSNPGAWALLFSIHFQINFVEDMETRDTLQLSSRKSDEVDSPPAVPSAVVQHAVLCLCSN